MPENYKYDSRKLRIRRHASVARQRRYAKFREAEDPLNEQSRAGRAFYCSFRRDQLRELV